MILLNDILRIHKRAIEQFGGSHGVRDWTALNSAIERPFQTFDKEDLYPDGLYKAAALLESILINHPFVDGNKRTGYAIARYFLRKNGFEIKADENEKYNFIISIASGQIHFDEIYHWLMAKCIVISK